MYHEITQIIVRPVEILVQSKMSTEHINTTIKSIGKRGKNISIFFSVIFVGFIVGRSAGEMTVNEEKEGQNNRNMHTL